MEIYRTLLLRFTVKGDSLAVGKLQSMRSRRLLAFRLRGLSFSGPYRTQRVLSPDSLSPDLSKSQIRLIVVFGSKRNTRSCL